MATGDDAAAAGMDLVPGSTMADTIDAELNKGRDYTAQFGIKPGTALAIARGGTNATTAADARLQLGLDLASPDLAAPNKVPVYNGTAQLTTADPTLGGHAASKAYVDWRVGSVADVIQALILRIEELEKDAGT